MARPIEVELPGQWRDTGARGRSLRRALAVLGRFCRRKPLGAVGAVIVLTLLVMAGFAEWIAPYAYDQQIPDARLKPPGREFLFGTDNVSRDVFSRIVYGARVSVTVGFLTVLMGNLVATAIGITSGYFRGRYDIVASGWWTPGRRSPT